MENIALVKEKAFLLHKYKFPVLNNCSIVRCEVKIANIDGEIISDKEVKIFGDYDISICYKTDSYYSSNLNKKQYNYQASSTRKFFLTERKAFSEIIIFQRMEENSASIQGLDLKYKFTSGPDAKANIISQNISDAFIYVEVSGGILIELISQEIENTRIKEILNKDMVLSEKSEDVKEDTNSQKNSEELKKEIELQEKTEDIDSSKSVNDRHKEDLLKIYFYTKENEQFVHSGGSSPKKIAPPIKVRKEAKSKFKKKLIENAEPIQSWMFQIKDNLSISDILKMDLDALQKMQEQKEPNDKEEKIEEDKKISLSESEEMKNMESELVLLKQNIETAGEDSTPPEAESLNLPIIEVGVLQIDKAEDKVENEKIMIPNDVKKRSAEKRIFI